MKTSEKGKYSPKKLNRCLQDVRDGILNPSSASRLYGIPRSTISCKIHKHRPEKKGKYGPEAVLGADVEQKLVSWLLDQYKRGFPLQKSSLLFSVTKLINNCFDSETIKKLPFRNGHPGEKWFQSFLKRHPCIVQKRSEYLSSARASVTEKKIRNWFKDVLDLLGDDAEVLKYPERLYNVDETAFFLNTNGKVVLAERGKSVYNINSNSDKDNVTVSICVNAIGEMAPPLIIYKYVRLPAVYGSSLPPGWSVGTSDSGWMNSETFYEYFANVFIPFVKKKHNNESVIVFFDGHQSHLSEQVSTLADENHVQLICLPASTTHFMQPLDVSYFRPLKVYWRKEKDQYEFEQKRSILKYEVPKMLQIIFDKYNLNNAAKNGFRKCGLFPFDPNNVDYSKCSQQLPAAEDEKSSSPSKSILEFFESKMDPSTLREFKASQAQLQWRGDEKFAALYDTWRMLVADDTSYAPINTDSILLDVPITYVETAADRSNPPIVECATSSDVQNESGIDILSLLHENEIENVELNNPGREFNIEFINVDQVFNCLDPNSTVLSGVEPLASSTPEKESDVQTDVQTPNIITQKEDCNCSCDNSLNTEETRSPVSSTLKETVEEPIQNTEKKGSSVVEAPNPVSIEPDKLPDEPIQNLAQEEANSSVSLKSVEDVLLDLTRADFTKKKGKMKASTSKTFPVITSEQWRNLEMSKQREKEEAERLKETNRLKRLEKQKENKSKKKNLVDFESEEMVDDPAPLKRPQKRKLMKQIDDNLQEKPTITKTVGRPKEQKTKAVVQRDENVDVGSWVLVQYNNQQYPGTVTKYDHENDEYEVKTLKKIQYQGTFMWKWPHREDKVFYEKKNIIRKLPSPVIRGGSRRGSDLFSFQNLS